MIIEAHALFSWDEFKYSLDVCRTTNGPLIETVTGYQETLKVFRCTVLKNMLLHLCSLVSVSLEKLQSK
jgi:hypothetical protein